MNEMRHAEVIQQQQMAWDALNKKDYATVVQITDGWTYEERDQIRRNPSGKKLLMKLVTLSPDVMAEAREALEDEDNQHLFKAIEEPKSNVTIEKGPEPGTLVLTFPPLPAKTPSETVQDAVTRMWPLWPEEAAEQPARVVAGHFWLISQGNLSEALPWDATDTDIQIAVQKLQKEVTGG